MLERYITLDIPDTDLTVMVKLDDEGVVIDVFERDLRGNDDDLDFDGVVASTWKMYDEVGVELIKFKEI